MAPRAVAELVERFPPAWRDAALAISRHPLVNRLHRVRQCGDVACLSSVTRFDHSVGTARLAIEVGYKVGASEYHVAVLGIAGLLHDIGHGPGSHVFDRALTQRGARPHEYRSVMHARTILDDTADAIPADATSVAAWVAHMIVPSVYPCPQPGYSALGTIIANDSHHIDVDKLDYVLRDATAAGLADAVPYSPDDMVASATCHVTLQFGAKHRRDVALVIHGRQMLHDAVYSCPRARAIHDALAELLVVADEHRAAADCVPPGPHRDALAGVRMSILHASAYPGWWSGFDDRFVDVLAQTSHNVAVRTAALRVLELRKLPVTGPSDAEAVETRVHHPARCPLHLATRT